MSTMTMHDVAQSVKALPRLPAMTLRLVALLCNPASPMREIVDTIRYDPSLTAEVLRLCNSAYFGLARRVNSLDEAARLLGTSKMLQLVVAAHTQTMLARPQAGYGLPPGSLWNHSVAVALGCQVLGKRLNRPEIGLLFTAGLLHDIGKVVLNEHVAESYAEIARRVAAEKKSFSEAEREVLGFTHAEMGAHVARAWELPKGIVAAIEFHHEPAAVQPVDPLVDLAHISDCICLSMGIGGGDDGLAYRAHPETVARYGLTEADLDAAGAEIVLELKGVQSLFSE